MRKKNKKALRRKIVLRLPDLDHAKISVLNTLSGKGGHVRTVPMPLWVKAAIDRWISAANVKRAARHFMGQGNIRKRHLVRRARMCRTDATGSSRSA
jgi:hypothetical protein